MLAPAVAILGAVDDHGDSSVRAGRVLAAFSTRARENGDIAMSDTAQTTDAGAETGSWFPVPDEAELPDGLRGLFAKARERLGFVPNVFRVYSFRPERLSAWFAHFRQLHEPTEDLSAADREMVAVVVSAANGCLYCLVAHGAALRRSSATRCSASGSPMTGVGRIWIRAAPRSAPTPRSSPCARAR